MKPQALLKIDAKSWGGVKMISIEPVSRAARCAMICTRHIEAVRKSGEDADCQKLAKLFPALAAMTPEERTAAVVRALSFRVCSWSRTILKIVFIMLLAGLVGYVVVYWPPSARFLAGAILMFIALWFLTGFLEALIVRYALAQAVRPAKGTGESGGVHTCEPSE